jgi:hydrogenase-4 component B
MAAATLAGLGGAFLGFRDSERADAAFPWAAVGHSVIGVDALSAFFLMPIFVVGGLGSLYGLGYWPQSRHRRNGRTVSFFWGLLVAGMTLLVVARHAMAFLFGWEVMALSAFFLVSTENHRSEVRWAGLLYLIATHVGTLALFALFALWRSATGSFAFRPLPVEAIDVGVMNVLFFLALLAFGVKAGMMPLHFWLPTAHANAPTHVSAILSGVVLKMGIYGFVRFLFLMPAPPPAWGGAILALGAIGGLLGVLFALGQHDLKRLLAYHSVENIGIILIGLGVALLGRSSGRTDWVVLGLAGCLLHVWNHALFKSLLFFSAGSVVHATRTRDLDRLGGLAKSMPWTAAAFLAGAVAICGLPPLNGFVSELTIYLGLFRSAAAGAGEGGSAALLGVPALATIGALALACFVKAHGAVFLGAPRTPAAARAHEAPATMTGPMFGLVACCAIIGVLPMLVVPGLESAVRATVPELRASAIDLATLVPLRTVSILASSLVAFAAVVALPIALGRVATRRAGTWDCGYAMPTGRMQYSASSFAQTIVALGRTVLRPVVHGPRIEGFHPGSAAMRSHVDDAVLDRLLLPASREVDRWLGRVRRFQGGRTQDYVLYVLVTVIVLLSFLFPLDEYVRRLFAR